jgi:hypothetical protein
MLSEFDRLRLYNECLNTRGLYILFCDSSFGKAGHDRGFYHFSVARLNDIAIISDNLYSTYAFLFILLGIILTLVLLAALSLLKGK